MVNFWIPYILFPLNLDIFLNSLHLEMVAVLSKLGEIDHSDCCNMEIEQYGQLSQLRRDYSVFTSKSFNI